MAARKPLFCTVEPQPPTDALVLPPHLLPSVDWFAAYVAALDAGRPVVLATEGVFRKQVGLNQYQIKGPNKVLLLTAHVQRTGPDTPLANAMLSFAEDWPRRQARGLETAYRSTPYWEHYAEPYLPMLRQPPTRLLKLTLALLAQLCTDLELPVPPTGADLADAVQPKPHIKPYYQIHGPFAPGLTALDLLLHEGPRAMRYLR